MKDVAQAAQVSIATVTRAINGTGYVSAETRAKVEKAIKDLDYVPNKMAGILKSHHSGILGSIVAPSRGNLFAPLISEAITKHAAAIGYHILTMLSDDDPHTEKTLMNDLFGRMVDGIILVGGVHSNPKDIQSIIDKGVPVIMIERPLTVQGADKVLIDSFGGSATAADHILRHGHTQIGFIGREKLRPVEIDRCEGFIQTLAQNGLTIEESHCLLTEQYDPQQGYQAMKKMLSGKRRPSAVFISSDITAYGALQYLYHQGIRVPEDVSIVGYDNTFSAMTSPSITSVATPLEEIAKTVMQLFRERKQERRRVAKSILLSPFLVQRGSVKNMKT